MAFSLIDDHQRRDTDRRLDQGPAGAVARNRAGASAQLAARDRLFGRCRQARAGAGSRWRARPGAGRARRGRRRRAGDVGAGRVARGAAGGKLPARNRAGGRRPDRGWRSAGRSAPMPSPATTRGRRAARRWSGPKAPTAAGCERLASAVFLARDLVNTPAGDLGPEELAAAAVRVAETAGACHRVIVGDELLAENYPTIHAVGRASTRAPRLVDIVWGEPSAPKVTLVGKGVCFDSGGLDLKTAAGMRLMKKDMGGAAIMLGLAQAIIDAKLPVRLRVLLPCVENSVSRQCDAPDGHRAHAQGADRRDRQHRRRGPADPVRRAGRGLDREAGNCWSTWRP